MEIKITDTQLSEEYTFSGIISQMAGWEYPEAIVVVEDIAGDGAVGVNSKFGRRNCSFVYIPDCDVLEERDQILKVMRQDGKLRLVEFTDINERNLQFEAYIKRVLMPYTNMRKPILVELEAPDYRFYSQIEHVNESVATEQIITNQGHEHTPPVFRLNGPFTKATVLNLNNNDFFEIDANIADGDFVIVDVAKQLVLLDGTTSMYSDLTGDFFSLEPGDNNLQVTFEGSGGNTTLITRWRDAWYGI